MVCLYGFKVDFLVNGQPAEEFDEPVHGDEPVRDEASRYILAVAGASFAFRCIVPPRYSVYEPTDSVRFKLILNGEWRRSLCTTREQNGEPTIIDGGHYNTATGSSLRGFRFADLHTHGKASAYIFVSD